MNLRRLVVGVFAAALLGLGGSVARAQEFIKVGEPVVLELPLENEDTSTATAQGVRLVATFEEVTPAGLASYLSVDEAGSVLGPVTIDVGAASAQTLKAKIVLAAGAPDGSFKVRLHPSVENENLLMSPDPETLDTLVLFRRSGGPVRSRAVGNRSSLLARQTVPVDESAPRARGGGSSGDSGFAVGGLR